MTTTKAYDDLVERLRSGGSSKSQARRVATQLGEPEPKRKGGWPKGKPRKPKAAK